MLDYAGVVEMVLADRDAFWRVADDPRGDAVALVVLAGAFASVFATIVCALRVCSLVCARSSTRRRRPPTRSSFPLQPSLAPPPPPSTIQEQSRSRRRPRAEGVPSPPPLLPQQQRQLPASWAIKWAPAVADEEAVAAARIDTRKSRRREPAVVRDRPLPRSVLTALDRVSARIAALPDPH
ncbi:hypothetical protein psal_cds_48 [Pandoravirus salinus]|uniref:Uncharacterized protein n=1 Tax=Pandoravirus salinus TaxID=1349410 RepID=S4VVJ6_9VIRU|nr:hypothetical protein psal_cds_48 [Pandoravirus salinus]AGO83436.1 hypothetical protein psal_cds_48 [Pandoravirus salinus]